MKGQFTGIYRGIVIQNDIEGKTQAKYLKGKIKIFVPGVYSDYYKDKPNLLPWAQPAMSLFGGNWKNQRTAEPNAKIPPPLNLQTGWCSIPHTGKEITEGAQVFLFFEAGDVNKPVYFAGAQSGPGWLSQHTNQHVIQTDNVRICIDEQPNQDVSTCKYEPYLKLQDINDAVFRKEFINNYKADNPEKIPTRVDIQIAAPKETAINLQITGNVNMDLYGDWITRHHGDRYDTHIGNTYQYHSGTTHIYNEGNIQHKNIGTIERTYDGSITEIIKNKLTKTIQRIVYSRSL